MNGSFGGDFSGINNNNGSILNNIPQSVSFVNQQQQYNNFNPRK